MVKSPASPLTMGLVDSKAAAVVEIIHFGLTLLVSKVSESHGIRYVSRTFDRGFTSILLTLKKCNKL